ncbi:MAG TPA: branched-chain amino acid ABC transporter permease [Ktedonobacterales bacterium]|nr:branched-chain amino acid ABC transporter permease [Ktedonobacterales bacterium]
MPLEFDPVTILDAVLAGVLTGTVYALMATGLSLIFGVLDIIDVAQAGYVILAAYLSFILLQTFHIDLFLGLLITMPLLFLLGLGVEVLFIRPIKRDRTQLSILVTFGIGLVIEGILGVRFGTTERELDAWYVTQGVKVGNFYVAYVYIFAFILALALIAALFFLLYRTKFGRSVRALMQNRTAAQLIGINVERVSAITFAIGVALTAAGGMAYGATTPFNNNSWYDLITRLFAIIILGGLGSVQGALIGAIIMLVCSDVTAVVWSPVWSSAVFFFALVLLLLFRPQGLFGRLATRKQ